MSCFCERGDEGLEGVEGSGNFKRLIAVGLAFDKMEGGFGNHHGLGQRLDNRRVGLALVGCRRYFDAERHGPVGRPVKPGDFVTRGLGRDPDGKQVPPSAARSQEQGRGVINDEIAQELQGQQQHDGGNINPAEIGQHPPDRP